MSSQVIACAIEVHKALGPGLLESVYEICLAKELYSKGIRFNRQVVLPVMYKNELLDLDFRIDILVEQEIILELKAVEALLPVHEAQLITYLRLANKRLGFLINFNQATLKDGIKRRVNNF
jgi:GxxExxY protein